MTLPEHDDGHCTNCGSEDLILAEDLTCYSPCEFVGTWQRRYSNTEASSAHDAVRFFCTECGTPHAVPNELA